jgi:hypothetical protein
MTHLQQAPTVLSQRLLGREPGDLLPALVHKHDRLPFLGDVAEDQAFAESVCTRPEASLASSSYLSFASGLLVRAAGIGAARSGKLLMQEPPP